MGKLTILPTPLAGAVVVETNSFQDERGSFSRFFCSEELSCYWGNRSLVNINFSSNVSKGTLRGIHTQRAPAAEMKMIRCIRGCLFDVIVDLRAGSPTFLQWFGVELSASNQRMLIVPEGCGHGFQTLDDSTDALYLTTARYQSEAEMGIHYADPCVGISWPLPVSSISDKDRLSPFLPSNFAGL